MNDLANIHARFHAQRLDYEAHVARVLAAWKEIGSITLPNDVVAVVVPPSRLELEAAMGERNPMVAWVRLLAVTIESYDGSPVGEDRLLDMPVREYDTLLEAVLAALGLEERRA